MNGSQKRLAIFLPGLYGGGAERTMLNLATGFAGRGYAVDLVLAQAEGPYMAEVPETVRLVELNAHRLGAFRTLASLPALVRYLRQARPDALLSAMYANIVALWAKRLAGAPHRVVICEQNTFSRWNRQLPWWFAWLMFRLVKRVYPRADGICAVSEGVADDLAQVAEIPRDRIRIIYNPIVTPAFKAKAKESLQHPWFEPGGPAVVLAVGSLTAQKDFNTLIRAFAQVRQSRPARLLILGEGEERSKLEALVRRLGLGQDISLPGFVVNPYPYMTRASLFVLSSKWEGLPTVLVEAMSCNLPLIATDCPSGPREILRGGKYGRLVPVGDVAALSRAMEAMLNGAAIHPPRESWKPFESETIVNQYISVLFGT